MKLLLLVLVVVSALCFIQANGRNVDNEYENLAESEGQSDLINRMKEHTSQLRHRRRSRQMYGYDYPPPYVFLDHRKDSGNRQEDILIDIAKTLDEILIYMKRPPLPPPAPQPVYIQCPVYPPKPCNCPCNTYKLCKQPTNKNHSNTTHTPDEEIGNRFNYPDIMEDPNQIWVQSPDDTDDSNDDDYGSRPINLQPVKPNQPASRPASPVDHGSSQAGSEQSTRAPVSTPGICEIAILNCCILPDTTSKRNCFAKYNCRKTFATQHACEPQVINKVLDHFKSAYAPVDDMY